MVFLYFCLYKGCYCDTIYQHHQISSYSEILTQVGIVVQTERWYHPCSKPFHIDMTVFVFPSLKRCYCVVSSNDIHRWIISASSDWTLSGKSRFRQCVSLLSFAKQNAALLAELFGWLGHCGGTRRCLVSGNLHTVASARQIANIYNIMGRAVAFIILWTTLIFVSGIWT